MIKLSLSEKTLKHTESTSVCVVVPAFNEELLVARGVPVNSTIAGRK
jgi:hypothetical protein